MRRTSADQSGFTLVEATITIAVLALALGVVLFNWGSAAAELRTTAAKLSGTVRASYDSASLTGQTYRLVFSFEKPVIRVEATEELLSFDEDANVLARGARHKAGGGGMGMSLGMLMAAGAAAEESEELAAEDVEPPSVLTALVGLSQQDSEETQSAFQSADHDLPLGEGVRLIDVWVRGMSEPATEGEAYLYFFPHGYTQDALVHLEGEEGQVFSVRVWALTGRTEVTPEYVEVPE